MRKRLPCSKIGLEFLWAALALGIPNDLLLLKVNAADLDIREYGARCDGSDEAPAVQSALDSLADGARLLVPCRVGIGPSGLRLRRRNDVVIEGLDRGGFIALAGNPENVLFSVEYCNRCVFRFLNIDARNFPVAGFSINYSNESRVEFNTIENVAYPAFAAILGLGNRGNVYTWNTIARTGVYLVNGVISDGARGIWLGNPRDVWIEWNPVVSNNKLLDIGGSAIAINGAGAVITDNYVEGSKGSGVKISPPPGQPGRSRVERNTLRNNRFSGVQIESADSPVVILDNTLEQNLISGVYLSGGFADGEITGNRIAGSGEAGIYIYDANRALIQENEITGGKSGIVFEALRQGAIEDVRMYSNTVTGVSGNGLTMWGRGGSMRGVTLASNVFSNVKLYGLSIEEQNSGAILGPSLIANCFSNMGAGTLFDTRALGGLQPPLAALSCSRPPQARFSPLRINVGGGVYVDAKRQVWLPDTGQVEGHVFEVKDAVIANTTTPELYRSSRWKEGVMDFSIDVPNRVYTVTLKFAEPYFRGRGQRIFDIFINGEMVLPRFDILAHASYMEAVDRTFRVTVTNGKLAIHMVAHADDPMICAIEIQ